MVAKSSSRIVRGGAGLGGMGGGREGRNRGDPQEGDMESCAQRAMSLISSDMEEMVFCIDAESLVNRRTT